MSSIQGKGWWNILRSRWPEGPYPYGLAGCSLQSLSWAGFLQQMFHFLASSSYRCLHCTFTFIPIAWHTDLSGSLPDLPGFLLKPGWKPSWTQNSYILRPGKVTTMWTMPRYAVSSRNKAPLHYGCSDCWAEWSKPWGTTSLGDPQAGVPETLLKRKVYTCVPLSLWWVWSCWFLRCPEHHLFFWSSKNYCFLFNGANILSNHSSFDFNFIWFLWDQNLYSSNLSALCWSILVNMATGSQLFSCHYLNVRTR